LKGGETLHKEFPSQFLDHLIQPLAIAPLGDEWSDGTETGCRGGFVTGKPSKVGQYVSSDAMLSPPPPEEHVRFMRPLPAVLAPDPPLP